VVGFKEYSSRLFWACKCTLKIQSISLFWTFLGHLKPNQQLYVIGHTNLVFLAIFLLFI
jgi:hypothetical protein